MIQTLMYISMGHMMWNWPLPSFMADNHIAMGLIQLLLTIAIMVINQKFFISGFKSLIKGSPNMDTLVALGSGAAFVYSCYALFAMTDAQLRGNLVAVMGYMHEFYFESAAMILTLITVGKMLEARSKGKTTDALKSLMKLSPKTANIIRDDIEQTVPIESVHKGDIFVVRPELLRMVNEVEGIERIRFMTSHPKDMSDELILAMKECDKVCKNLHLPFQSGSTEILKKMNRHYTKEGYLELVRKVREAMPEITLSTDIIVGFPGETEEDFQETLDVIRKARYCTAFTFIYSKRTGTPAAKMENQVPEDVVKDRFDRMLQVLNPIVHEVTEEQVGKVLPVLVEEVSKHDENILTGRTEQNTLVHFSGSKDLIGQMVPVKIIENKTFYVIGERI